MKKKESVEKEAKSKPTQRIVSARVEAGGLCVVVGVGRAALTHAAESFGEAKSGEVSAETNGKRRNRGAAEPLPPLRIRLPPAAGE